MLELSDLILFRTVAEAGSITRAGERLNFPDQLSDKGAALDVRFIFGFRRRKSGGEDICGINAAVGFEHPHQTLGH